MALFVKLYLLIYILYSKSNFLVKNFDKTIISLLIILAPTMTSTIWLNTLVSQIYFSIFVILIFFQKTNTNNFLTNPDYYIVHIWHDIFNLLYFYTLFFFKYLAKKKENFISFLSLLIPTFIQSSIFIYSNLNELSDQNRFLLTSDSF